MSETRPKESGDDKVIARARAYLMRRIIPSWQRKSVEYLAAIGLPPWSAVASCCEFFLPKLIAEHPELQVELGSFIPMLATMRGALDRYREAIDALPCDCRVDHHVLPAIPVQCSGCRIKAKLKEIRVGEDGEIGKIVWMWDQNEVEA